MKIRNDEGNGCFVAWNRIFYIFEKYSYFISKKCKCTQIILWWKILLFQWSRWPLRGRARFAVCPEVTIKSLVNPPPQNKLWASYHCWSIVQWFLSITLWSHLQVVDGNTIFLLSFFPSFSETTFSWLHKQSGKKAQLMWFFYFYTWCADN